ncbi:hypothetical protein LRP88_12483 [Fusarium phalaenopsidis]
MESSKPSGHEYTQKAAIILSEARNAIELEIPTLLEAFYEEVVEWPSSNGWYFDDMFDALERLLLYYDLTESGGWENFLEQYNAVLEHNIGGPCDDVGEEAMNDEMGDEEATDDETDDEEATDDEMDDEEVTGNGEDLSMDMTT